MSPPPSVREVAENYSRLQGALQEEAVALVLSVANRGRTPERWRDAVVSIGNRLLSLQVASAGLADDYLTDVLEAQNASPLADMAVAPSAWMDYTDGGGSLLANLVFAPAKEMDRLRGDALLERVTGLGSSIVLTAMQDTGRSSTQTAMQARRATKSYVRMLNGASCRRCVVLAGRKYRRATPFRRHPRCDCRNIPSAESGDDWTVNPVRYFKSLSTEEQDRVFTKAGAETIRLSGNSQVTLNQVVNAEQGTAVVSAFGRDVRATTTGTTVRGLAGQRLAEDGLAKTGRYRAATSPRLLPDEIFQLADQGNWDRVETLRQLRRFGYLL